MNRPATRTSILLVGLLLSIAPGAQAQGSRVQVSVGPQLTTLGVGLGADVRVLPGLSLSAEYNIFPLREVKLANEVLLDIEDLDKDQEYTADLDIRGGLLAANLHPGEGKFVLGLGLFFGSYGAELTVVPDEPVEVGDEVYTPEEIGTLFGDFSIGDAAPAVYLGWRGRGIHFGAGFATRAPSEVALSADGSIRTEPEFQRELAKEIAEIEDELDKLQILPFIRLGWQFGL